MTGKAFRTGALAAACVMVATACGTAAGDTTQTGKPSAAPQPSQTLAHRPVTDLAGDAELEIHDLHRHGNLVTLDLGLRNTGGENLSAGTLFSRDGFENDISGIYLVDGENKKTYLPASYGGECVCSSWLQTQGVAPGQTQHLSATYGAPPAEVNSVNIKVPHVGTFRDIKIR